MPFSTTPIDGLTVFEPRVFEDERGHFFEAYNERAFRESGIDVVFVQDNEAMSERGILRGLHFQRGAAAQAKLVRVVTGEVYDVVVDIRPESPTYGRSHGLYLSEHNRRQLFIPRGLAHGYVVTSEEAVFLYKCDNFYDPDAEGGLRYDDPALGIEWPEVEGGYRLKERDRHWPSLAQLQLG